MLILVAESTVCTLYMYVGNSQSLLIKSMHVPSCLRLDCYMSVHLQLPFFMFSVGFSPFSPTHASMMPKIFHLIAPPLKVKSARHTREYMHVGPTKLIVNSTNLSLAISSPGIPHSQLLLFLHNAAHIQGIQATSITFPLRFDGAYRSE